MLKMVSKELRIHSWRFKEDPAVTEAMLYFSVHTYREAQLIGGRNVLDSDSDKQTAIIEREFIFSLAHKLGISCLRIFADSWQSFLSCQELQQLIVRVAPTDGDGDSDDEVTPTLAPELVKIINEFYNSQLFHDEYSCLLLTKYFKPTDTEYARIVAMILQNVEHYDASALFHLAQLQAGNRRIRKDVMDTNIFAIISRAFENLSGKSSPKICEFIDWLFTMCTSTCRDPARSPFYTKMINLICKHARKHQEILLQVLQRIESQGSLMKHSTAAKVGEALIGGYREHFVSRFRECGHSAYATIISEMHRARLECRHYVKNGDVMFDSEVIGVIRCLHSTKKKLMKLLSVDFPERTRSASF